jgi:hypothetical protein
VVDYNNYLASRDRLFNIEVKIGYRQAPADDTVSNLEETACKMLSDALYKYWGPRGFSDWNL